MIGGHFMDDFWTRIATNLADRVSGPMKFRLILQPIMASMFAVIAGLRDARLGKPPYLWSLLSDRAHRLKILQDAWKSVGRVFVLALALDVVYQVVVQHFVYPGEAVLTALVLAIVPYVILRGLVTRLTKK
jgi:hypothetical protein